MKNPFETLIIPGGILLLGFLSALLLPAPSFNVALAKQLQQTATADSASAGCESALHIVFCVWFLLLGTVKFFIIRFVWRRWFQLR